MQLGPEKKEEEDPTRTFAEVPVSLASLGSEVIDRQQSRTNETAAQFYAVFDATTKWAVKGEAAAVAAAASRPPSLPHH